MNALLSIVYTYLPAYVWGLSLDFDRNVSHQQLKLQLYEEKQNCKQLENRLRSQEKYREIVETQTELICRFLPDGTITFVNLAFSRYFNQSFQELIGKMIYSLIPPDEHQPLKTYLQSLSPQASVGTYKHPIILSSGEVRWQQSEVKIILSLAAQVNMAIQQSQLYHKLEEVNQELHRLATVDGLTQVANRRYFDTYLLAEWARLAREKLPISLILCDVDFFKKYNDKYGHLKGDECLKQVAEILEKFAQRPADLVARYGGEEFALILPNTDQSWAFTVAKLIQEKLAQMKIIHPDSPHHYVTLSQGISSCIPCPNTNIDLLIKRADDALYEAKAKGRNLIIVYGMELTTN
ncbi:MULTISPECIES: GGDEF domain-containing protein [Planktothrix]|uniref:GGDEF domain-containing protein n=1 Tax=Planktothrix TaxID=54304 RepID=UPI001646384D|nr:MULTISPECIES: diguanylate cyclase [Planktothrix]